MNNPSEVYVLSDVRSSIMTFKLDSDSHFDIEGVRSDMNGLKPLERTVKQKQKQFPLAPNDK